MSTVTVRLNPEEEKLFNEYSELVGVPLSTLFKSTLEEKLEYEFDLNAIKEYEEDNNEGKTYSHDEMKEILGL